MTFPVFETTEDSTIFYLIIFSIAHNMYISNKLSKTNKNLFSREINFYDLLEIICWLMWNNQYKPSKKCTIRNMIVKK